MSSFRLHAKRRCAWHYRPKCAGCCWFGAASLVSRGDKLAGSFVSWSRSMSLTARRVEEVSTIVPFQILVAPPSMANFT